MIYTTAVNLYTSEKLALGEWGEANHMSVRSRLVRFGYFWDGFVGNANVAEITREHLKAYRAHLLTERFNAREVRTAGTVNKILGDIKAFFDWVEDEGHGGVNPVRRLRIRRKVSDGGAMDKRSALSESSVRGLLSDRGCPPLLTFMALHGLRNTEALQLRDEDIREIDGVLCLDLTASDAGQLRKTSSSVRVVPVHPALRHPKAPSDGRSLSRQSRSAGAYLKARGIGETPYGLRHSFTAELRNKGIDPRVIQALLGHTPQSITDRVYGNAVGIKEMAAAIAAVNYQG